MTIEWVFDAVRAGASGYLLKDTPREEVIKAVRGTFEGKSYVDPGVAGKLMGQVAGQSDRTRDVDYPRTDRT